MQHVPDPRVLFAAERTLLAWNRTSLALIALGFLIERSSLLVILLLSERDGSSAAGLAFWVGLGFVALGIAAAVYSARQFAGIIRHLDPRDIPEGYHGLWGIVVNLLVAGLATALMVVLLLGR